MERVKRELVMGRAASWVARYGTAGMYGYRRSYNGRQSAVSNPGMHCGGRGFPELVTCAARSGLLSGRTSGLLSGRTSGRCNGRPPTVGRVQTPPAALPNKAAIFPSFKVTEVELCQATRANGATRRQFPSSCDLTRAKTPPPKASPSSQLPLPISPHLQLLQLRRQRCPTRHRQLKFDGESDPTLIFQSLLQSLLLDAASPDSLCCCCFFLPLFDVRRQTISVSTLPPRVPPTCICATPSPHNKYPLCPRARSRRRRRRTEPCPDVPSPGRLNRIPHGLTTILNSAIAGCARIALHDTRRIFPPVIRDARNHASEAQETHRHRPPKTLSPQAR